MGTDNEFLNKNKTDRVDQWLDRALRQYSDAEPRAGLEQRILANLESVRRNASIGHAWAWSFAAAALAACVGLAFWIGSTNHSAKRSVANVTSTPAPVVSVEPTQHVQPLTPTVHVAKHHVTRHVSRRLIEMANEPRLEQFPSPRPLSEQERLLTRYVTQCPQEAVTVAQAQLERRKELDKLFADESSKIESDQQER